MMTSVTVTYFRYILSVHLLLTVTSFNIDVDHNYLEYSGDKTTQFGYSISLIRNKDKPLVVGAPKFNGGKGAIFNCPLDQKTCDEVIFDAGKDANNLNRTRDQHFGFSLYYAGKRLMACAPKFYKKAGIYSQPVGKCSVFDDDMNLSYNDIPCGEKQMLLPSFGYCLAGTSIAGEHIGNEPLYFLGTPGARHMRGHIFTTYAEDGRDPDNPIYTEEHVQDFRTNSYIGYSVASGNILGDDRAFDVIGGAPGGYHLLGNALLYSKKYSSFNLKANLMNPDPEKRIGTYFGGAVCVADLNGDGKGDALIGAPYYSKILDEGRVYVYVNKGDSIPRDWEYDGLKMSYYLEGDGTLGGRFGTTIVNIGDLNKDSFTDIAIGAPGGDRGAVFIYNCGLSGIPRKYSQVIYASQVPGTPAGFGISIASGVDVDGNSYNDLAIGAYLQGKAYIFKSRAIITLQAHQSVNTTSIPLERKNVNCYWKNVGYYCIKLELNLRYAGDGTPSTFELEITFDLDTQVPIRKRSFIIDTTKNKLVSKIMNKIRLRKAVTTTVPVILYNVIRPDIDMPKPIHLETSFEAHHDPSACGDQPCGILDFYTPRKRSTELSYNTRCGADKICSPDLRVKSVLSFYENPGVTEMIYGVVKKMLINTTIYNKGEPAYQPKIENTFNSDFVVERVELNGKSHPIWDLKESNAVEKKLLIPLASFIAENSSVNIVVIYALGVDKPSVREYSFTMEAKSIGQEVNPRDNKKTLKIGTKVETCIAVAGDANPPFSMSTPDPMELPKVNATVGNIGVPVEYTFFVKNNGSVPVELVRTAVTIVTEKYGVKLMCVAGVTVDDIPCQGNNAKASCQEILDNPKLYGVSGAPRMEERSLNCRNAGCETLQCQINRLGQGKEAIIKVNVRIMNVNFAKVAKSMFETLFDVSFIGPEKDIYMQREGCITNTNVTVTVEVPVKQSAAKEIPFWIIIVAALAALLLLVIIVIILYKKKFFERKKLQPEEEPLKEDEMGEET